MGRKELKVDQASLACAQIFCEVRDSKNLSMYRIKKDFGISNGRIDRLFQGLAAWSLDEFMEFCIYFSLVPSVVIVEIQALSVDPNSVQSQADLGLVAHKQKRKIGTETDEGFFGA